MEYNNQLRKIMLQTARDSILERLQNKQLISHIIDDYPEKLRLPRACFVTLHLNSHLRGCIGSLITHQALILDLIQNAQNAAFNDPRFTPLSLEEYAQIHLAISVLSATEKINFVSEQDLLNKIRPGIDGLILSDHGYRGTFLPSVWEQLPDPTLFLQHLKNKAGLPANYWSETLQIERYQTEIIDEASNLI